MGGVGRAAADAAAAAADAMIEYVSEQRNMRKGVGWEGGGEVEGEGGRGGGRRRWHGHPEVKRGGGVPPPFGTGFKPHFRYQVSVFKLGVQVCFGPFGGEILAIAPPKRLAHLPEFKLMNR